MEPCSAVGRDLVEMHSLIMSASGCAKSMAASFHALVGSRFGTAFPFLVVRSMCWTSAAVACGSKSLVGGVVMVCCVLLLGAVKGGVFCRECGCVVLEVEGVPVCEGGMYG
eukprot:6491001-Amphidinium_carterae.1